ncbi:DEAD/DEAH box helicase [Sphingomonas oligophenolica]|uniref:Transcription-repair-coupling factor n=1 Tax=Sphingomonas oligophenolica TaxID=301154 RepID=A0A502C692_9SPHN|nr:DEAD/DEAH box helicase [Sphingomonas oligophenolica]TPG07489.1 DEAD/DEAH box helicase [Sphingomonas oligophenolica]
MASVGLTATRLADALEAGDVLFIAIDEQRAEAVAEALRSAAPDAQVIHSPSSDALPGETGAASPSNVGRRLAALRAARVIQAAPNRATLAFVTTAEAASGTYPPPIAFDQTPPTLTAGDTIDIATLAETLQGIGYFADDRVDEPGEMAVLGQVVDLFPADSSSPVRVEVQDGLIAGIRCYDPVSQLGLHALDHIEIGRVAEPPVEEDWVSLFDHMPDAEVAADPGVAKRRDRYIALAKEAMRAGGGIILADAVAWERALARRRMIDLTAGPDAAVPRFVEGKAPQRAFERFVKAALAREERVVVLGADRDLRFLGPRIAKAVGVPCETVAAWRDVVTLPTGTIGLLTMPVDRGWQGDGVLAVAAADLLGGRALNDREVASAGIDPLRGELGDIRIGDVVVHEDFGIGRVAGIEPSPTGGIAEGYGDAIVLEYAGAARRLVPVYDADRLWRYGADADAVALDKLDGSTWKKRRVEIDAAIAASARGLTALAAERDRRTAPPLEPDVSAYERFAADFAFTETSDQARAIAAVRSDLAAGKPMDRLVVGDVGYGKTEVALRAAAIAALAGKQVVVAAPTTVLVRQHLEVFRQRFSNTGLTVAGLSRLSSAAEKKAVKAGLADGSIALVIGTGAVASKNVRYRDLALVVIDEEQRFGASDKAKLRALNPDGHVLTLTATPIPRTLQTALIGLQQVSVIATPPARRQPIRTSVGAFDPALLRTALLREKGRGGQSFVVVPRIEDMEPMATRLADLVPGLVIRSAHGKLPAAEIDEAMVAFAGGDGDVLLATNIIEAGLDVPRANTMIVWRADRFGLSQLHQLRGRVGRGGRRGQIMLVTDPDTPIAEATLKRLRTLEALDRLGAGFAISARDLDMRGAGELLGDAQAGHMKLIGVDLYQHLLEGALRTARGEQVDRWSPVLRVGASGRLPEEWIPEADVRIALYSRLARLADARGLDAFEAELEDRFGNLPEAADDLLALAKTRLLARATCIARIDAGPTAIALTPRPDFCGATANLEAKDGRLLLRERIDAPGARLQRILTLLHDLLRDN